MIRGLVLAVAICTSMLLLACGSDDGGGGDTAGGGGGADVKAVMITFPPGDDFYYTIEQTARAAAEKAGVDLEVQAIAKYEAASQLPVLNAAIAKNPDVIIISPTDEDALQAPLEQAKERGIKIILYDTKTKDPSVAETYVSADVKELGRSAAKTQAELIGERGKVFYQGTAPNQTFFDNLHLGWQEVMEQHPDIEELPKLYSDFEPSKANSQLQAVISGNPDLAGGFMGIFLDQQGEVPALKKAGLIGKVKTVGVDGAPQNVQRVRDGELDAIVSPKAKDYGPAIIEAAVAASKDEKLPADTVIGQCILTQETLDEPANEACLYDKAPS